jgi:serine/threonine-protein kinase
MAELNQLGKYKVLEVLGKGAMGVVYKGFDPLIERSVALKTIRKELIDQHLAGEIVARFKNEAQAAGRLNHPGIVAIYDYGEDENAAYIAMEFVQGRSLRECLALRESFNLPSIVGFMGQLLQALDYAHDHGVVHRDIKPANIIMMANGKLKVADFGIARIDRSSLTSVGSIMGTPSYMSPEQYAGQVVDRRTDVFSAGIVFYELLTGRKPFEGSPDTIGYKICHEPHRPPSELRPPGVPQVFDAVVNRALAKKPSDRYFTAGEFADAVLLAFEQRERKPQEDETTDLDADSIELVVPIAQPEAKDPGSDVKNLLAIEELFARHVGPIARVLIKKAANSATDGGQLINLLAKSINGEQEKKSFISEALSKLPTIAAQSGQSNPGGVDTRVALPPLSPEGIETAASQLVPYLGPIAKIVAKKTAARTPDLRTLYLQLADRIPDVESRKKFLKDSGYG